MSARKVRSTSPEAIKRRNEAFAKLTPAQKRITVAKDVIASLNAKRIKAKANVYLSAQINYDRVDALKDVRCYSDEWYAKAAEFATSDAQTALLSGQLSCEACALGSVFVCAVERMDRLNVNELKYSRRARIREYLDGIFSPEQLDLMEVAFESTTEHVKSERYAPDEEDENYDDSPDYICPCLSNGAKSELQAALDFKAGEDADTDGSHAEARMRAIMKNIIANGGEFKP